jgi:hypothetical protein
LRHLAIGEELCDKLFGLIAAQRWQTARGTWTA